MKSHILLPVVFVLVFALSRIPGLMPSNFSVAYAFAFCCGVFFKGARGWWLPIATLFATDIGLNFYWQYKLHTTDVWSASNLANLIFNYAAYAALIFLGRRFKPQSSLFSLVGGGLLGAILFYVITNTASWLFNPFHNPEYTKNLAALDHCPHQGHRRLSAHLGIFPQHPFEQRTLQPALWRRRQISRRISGRQNRGRARTRGQRTTRGRTGGSQGMTRRRRRRRLPFHRPSNTFYP